MHDTAFGQRAHNKIDEIPAILQTMSAVLKSEEPQEVADLIDLSPSMLVQATAATNLLIPLHKLSALSQGDHSVVTSTAITTMKIAVCGQKGFCLSDYPLARASDETLAHYFGHTLPEATCLKEEQQAEDIRYIAGAVMRYANHS